VIDEGANQGHAGVVGVEFVVALSMVANAPRK